MRATVEVETSHRLFSAPRGDNVSSGLKQWAIQVGFAVRGKKPMIYSLVGSFVQFCFCEIVYSLLNSPGNEVLRHDQTRRGK